jgi:Tfp pilus assembly protein PilX
MKTRPSPFASERGSLLIVAMILSAVIGISIASYIRLGVQSQKISNRALYNNAAINLAERGMEEAMYSINQMVNNGSYDWSGWTNDGTASDSSAWRKWTGYTFDQNATGIVRVYIYNYRGVVAPRLVARSTVTLGGQTSAPIEKWIEVSLSKTSKFANGLVAKNNIRFSGGNVVVDSWFSDPDNDNDPADAVPYSDGVKRDNGSVGSISIAPDSVDPGNGSIYGYAATGGSGITVGPQGRVGPFGTADGDIADGHTSTDFSASFDAVTPPSTHSYTPISAITNSTSLPGTVAAAGDGKYYIECPSVSFNNKTLSVEAGKEVILKLTDTSTGIAIGGGSGAININTGGKLIVYTAGSVAIAGNGVTNGGTTNATAGAPINFQIWGTRTSGSLQSISIKGNGVLSGVIYAPYASVTMNGGGSSGSVMGSIVADNITVTGGANFHYDESLANFGGGNPYRVTSWRELTTAASRNSYASILDF